MGTAGWQQQPTAIDNWAPQERRPTTCEGGLGENRPTLFSLPPLFLELRRGRQMNTDDDGRRPPQQIEWGPQHAVPPTKGRRARSDAPHLWNHSPVISARTQTTAGEPPALPLRAVAGEEAEAGE